MSAAQGSTIYATILRRFVEHRVAYGIPPLGSYSEVRNYPVDKLLHLPDGLDDRIVAALLMKGMTAHYLLHRTYKVQSGDTILIHADVT